LIIGHLDVTEYQNVAEWKAQIPDLSRVFLMSSHASKSYLETDFQDGDWLVLVKSKGLSQSSRTVRKSPNYSMSPLIRSFNIANSVAFVIGKGKNKFERLRNYKLPFSASKQYASLNSVLKLCNESTGFVLALFLES
jgi:tRNA (cytidine/uridine-2'-O-)-methyltransferase